MSARIQPNTAHLSSHGHGHVCLLVLHSGCLMARVPSPLEGEQELGEGTDSGCLPWILFLCIGCSDPQRYHQMALGGIFESLRFRELFQAHIFWIAY